MMPMPMPMIMIMIIVVMVVPIAVTVIAVGADAADVMMVAFLADADLALVADELLAILAELAVHLVVAGADLGDALGEAVEHQRVIAQIVGFDELDAGMACRHRVGLGIDALHQDAGEQKIREHHDAAETEPHGAFERGIDARMRHAGIGGLRPGGGPALPEHARGP